MSKVRQYRQVLAQIQISVKELSDTLRSATAIPKVHQESRPNRDLSQRQQLLEGNAILDRTTQSIVR